MGSCMKCERKNICWKRECFGATQCNDDFIQTKQSYADKLRSMSDEELAEFLTTIIKGIFGEEYEGEMSCLDWLQSEVKE